MGRHAVSHFWLQSAKWIYSPVIAMWLIDFSVLLVVPLRLVTLSESAVEE